MYRRSAVALLLFVAPSVAWAQSKADAYLPANTALYFRWDGIAAHREDFNKSAIGKTLQGDTGEFLEALLKYIQRQVDTFGNELGPQAGQAYEHATKFCRVVGANGFRFGVAADTLQPPQAEAVVVFPKAGAGKDNLLPSIREMMQLGGVELTESKIAGRTVYQLNQPPVNLGFWNENGDLVISASTGQVQTAVMRASGKGANLTTNPLYKKVSGFKEFSTWASAYLDVASVLKKVGDVNPAFDQIISDLGLKSLKSVTFQSGFDGPAERGVIEIDAPGPRKGLLRLASQKKFSLKDLPPVPKDVNILSASSFDMPRAYDVVMEATETVMQVFAPNELGQLKDGIQQMEAALGFKLRDELLASMGDMFVYYSSPTEIPLGLGATYAVKLSDEKKMKKVLSKLLDAAAGLPGAGFETRTRTYHGAAIHSLVMTTPGGFQVPSFVVYKGWFVFSSYPQPVQGFVLRMNGELPAWKANKKLAKTLSTFPKEFTGFGMSDPRPTAKLLLSLVPPAVAAINGFAAQFGGGGVEFDVTLIPNSHEATRYLFPNVMVYTDDGSRIRITTRASLMLPF